MIVDKLGRRFRNVRVSLTAAFHYPCHYACTYCMPDGKRLQPARMNYSRPNSLRA